MITKSESVEDRFPRFNCAQTVFSLYAPELGLDEKTAMKISSGFGGGMACAETCGAVTGAYMVIGLKYAHATSNLEEKAKTKQLVQKFNAAFKEKHGSLICKKLIGYDISKPEVAQAARISGVFKTKCPVFIKSACIILEEKM